MPLLQNRTYGPTHLTLDACRESSRPTIVQSLAGHVYELQQENAKLRQQSGQGGSEATPAAPPLPSGA